MTNQACSQDCPQGIFLHFPFLPSGTSGRPSSAERASLPADGKEEGFSPEHLPHWKGQLAGAQSILPHTCPAVPA